MFFPPKADQPLAEAGIHVNGFPLKTCGNDTHTTFRLLVAVLTKTSYFYAAAFARVAQTLTADQKKTLLRLRNLDAKYTCKGAYLYSRAIDMPEVPNTDFLFGASSVAAPAAAPWPGGRRPAARWPPRCPRRRSPPARRWRFRGPA